LIAGLGPVGVEAAKNIILQGVKKVTLWDNKSASWSDLGAQYYLSESDVKQSKNRASSSFQQLKELNSYVNVELLESAELSESVIAEHNVLLVTDTVNLFDGSEEKLLSMISKEKIFSKNSTFGTKIAAMVFLLKTSFFVIL
jgi:ubiquitin-activating enzyme E1